MARVEKFVTGSLKERSSLAKEGLFKWKQANRQGKMLSPDDFHTDFNTLLTRLNSTKGQFIQALTLEDLQQIQRTAAQIGKKYKGGITPQQVINRSLPIDRKRSNNEIKFSIMSHRRGNVFKFTTDASQKNDATKHYVTVEFTAFYQAVSSPLKMDKIVKGLTNSYVKFDCDCGRHTFWYRYLATAGKFAYIGGDSRAEHAFPKIRNPRLSGVACKHVLRTMQTIIGDSRFHNQLAKAIEMERKGKNKERISEKDARKHIKEMEENSETVLTTRGRKSANRAKEYNKSTIFTNDKNVITRNIKKSKKTTNSKFSSEIKNNITKYQGLLNKFSQTGKFSEEQIKLAMEILKSEGI